MEETKENDSYAGCGCVVVIILIICFFMGSCGSSTKSSHVDVPRPSASESYREAIDCAKQGKWEDVAVKMVNFRDDDVKYKALYSYANAQKNYAKNDFSMAQQYLKDIPEDYSGEFANEINQMKKLVEKQAAEQRKQEEEKRKAKEAERASRLYIGDPEEKIRKVWGEPDSVNRHVSEYGTNKQYVYYRGSKMVCIYTENGVVTDFQD